MPKPPVGPPNCVSHSETIAPGAVTRATLALGRSMTHAGKPGFCDSVGRASEPAMVSTPVRRVPDAVAGVSA